MGPFSVYNADNPEPEQMAEPRPGHGPGFSPFGHQVVM